MELVLNIINQTNLIIFSFDENIADQYGEYNSKKDIPIATNMSIMADSLKYEESGFTRLKELENFANFVKNNLKNKTNETFNFLELNLAFNISIVENIANLKLLINSNDLTLEKNIAVEAFEFLENTSKFVEELSVLY